MNYKEDIPGSRPSTHGYILTYFGLQEENLSQLSVLDKEDFKFLRPRMNYKEEIPGSRPSTHGYILTYFRL